VDIAVKGLPKNEYYRFVADISSLLERPVDVIELENCAFRETIEMRGSRWEAQAS
jgi:hypothetical protein